VGNIANNRASKDIDVTMSASSFMLSLLHGDLSTSYFNNLPVPANKMDKNTTYQVVPYAGSFFKIQDNPDNYPYAVIDGTNVAIPETNTSVKKMSALRKKFAMGMSDAMAKTKKLMAHDDAIRSLAIGHVRKHLDDRSMLYSFEVKGSNNETRTVSKTPQELLVETAMWRLDPESHCQSQVLGMSNNELMRELLYLMIEQNINVTRLLLETQDIKMMKAMTLYQQSSGNPMGGPSQEVTTNITNYVDGASSSMSVQDIMKGGSSAVEVDMQDKLNDVKKSTPKFPGMEKMFG
jgi:hypothetical protein